VTVYNTCIYKMCRVLTAYCTMAVCSDQLDVFSVLTNLTTVRRFATMVMFLSAKDKQG